MDEKIRKCGRSLKRYAWALCLLTILCLMILASCKETPDPGTSPIHAMATPEPGLLGYFMFDSMGEMSGTVTISQTLRTLDGLTLSSRAFVTQLSIPDAMTDTIAPPFAIPNGWDVIPGETVEEWTEEKWRVDRQYGNAITIAGVWYTDTTGPPAVPVGDAYMTRRIELWRVFFPFTFE